MLGVIERRITELVSSFLAMPDDERLDDVCAAVLHATIRQATVSSEGGKRLRALLAVDTFDALASDDSRRGALIKPAAHKALAGPAHDTALGTGLGIMLGDLLATASVDIANGAARQLPNADAIIQAFLTMHREVEIGQVLDLAAVQCPMSDPERLAQASLDVFRWKTASYTTIAPLELGMLASGMSPAEARRHALAIGAPLGLAFQLTDDLLDVVGSSSATGKPIGGDIREGKRTVLLADALTGATPDERHELTAMFEAPVRDETQTARTIALFHTTGAIDRSRERIETLWARSLHAIEAMGCPTESRTILEQACARFVPSVHYTPREQDSM